MAHFYKEDLFMRIVFISQAGNHFSSKVFSPLNTFLCEKVDKCPPDQSDLSWRCIGK